MFIILRRRDLLRRPDPYSLIHRASRYHIHDFHILLFHHLAIAVPIHFRIRPIRRRRTSSGARTPNPATTIDARPAPSEASDEMGVRVDGFCASTGL